ncbi:MAG: YbjN domain-containing protein, partial [Planctomycetota bacterium]
LFTGGAGVTVTLGEDGEYVLFRSLPLLTWEEVAEEHRVALLEHLLQRNNRLKVGHYSQSDEITFESSLVVEDGEVTDQQLDRCMGAVVSEVTNHGPKIRALAYGQEIEDSIDELIQRLIDDEDEA